MFAAIHPHLIAREQLGCPVNEIRKPRPEVQPRPGPRTEREGLASRDARPEMKDTTGESLGSVTNGTNGLSA
jgi:hypothetical protein